MKQIVLFVSVLMFFLVWFVNAAEPNFTRSVIYNVDGASSNITTTSYSDGLQRSIQSKQQLSGGKARVASTFFDDAGRPYITTKPFIDKNTNLSTLFTPGDFTEIKSTLNNPDNYARFITHDSNAYAYSEINYLDNPLGIMKRASSPGYDHRLESGHFTAAWSFGVTTESISVISLPVTGVTIKVHGGFVDAFSSPSATTPLALNDEILDELYDVLLQTPIADADHFLSVARGPDGKYSQERKDLFNRTDSTRSGVETNPFIAGYEYDIIGNLLKEIAPKDGGTTLINSSMYEYSTLGQLLKKNSPDGGTFGYDYTPTGQLAHDTSYNGTTIYRIRRYLYDDLDRLVSTELKDDNDPEHNDWSVVVSSYYDNVDDLDRDIPSYIIPCWLFPSLENLHGRLVASIAVNRISGISYYVCDLYSYDDEGRIDKRFKIVPGLPLQEIFYSYDIHGKILRDSTVCGAQMIVKGYQYDQEGRLIHIVHSNNGDTGKTVASYNYDDLGHTTDKTLGIGAGHQITYGYNIRDWVTSIKPVAGNHFKFTDTIVQYQANGNIQHAQYIYESTSPGPVIKNFDLTYTYDEVNRLTGVTQAVGTGFSANYTYDKAGRFISKEEGSVDKPGYRYYSGNSRLKNTSNNDSAIVYLYDKHGNLVIDKNKKMVIEYDFRDMPVAFKFYSAIPSAISADLSSPGQYVITSADPGDDLYRYMSKQTTDPHSGITLLSQVVMYYDASGNRVLKVEGK